MQLNTFFSTTALLRRTATTLNKAGLKVITVIAFLLLLNMMQAVQAQTANLSIMKFVDATSYLPGGTLTYTIRVTNNGPNGANNVTITDNVPSDITNAEYTLDGLIYQPWTSVYDIVGTMSFGASFTIRIRGTVSMTATGEIVNTASVSSTTYDPDLTDNFYTVAVNKAIPACMIVETSTYYVTLDDALTAVTNGQTIRLLTDITHTDQIDITGKTVTLDVGVFTLTVNNASGHGLNVTGGGKLYLNATTGAFNVSSSSAFYSYCGVYVSDPGSAATVTNASRSNSTSNPSAAAKAENGGILTVTDDATNITTPIGDGAMASNGGIVTVGGNAEGVSSGVYANNGASIHVTGNAIGSRDRNVSIGAQAEYGSSVTVGGNAEGGIFGAFARNGASIQVTGDAIGTRIGTGALATIGSSVTVGGNAEGVEAGLVSDAGSFVKVDGNAIANGASGIGVRAYSSGSVTVGGNVTSNGASGIGVYAGESGTGGTVTVDGAVTGNTYIRLGTGSMSWVDKTAAEFTNPPNPAKTGYRTYADATSIVYVKGVAPAITGGATIDTDIITLTEGYTSGNTKTYAIEGDFSTTGIATAVNMSTAPGTNTAGATVSSAGVLTIPAGLTAAGSPYTATFIARNGIHPNATMTVTINVNPFTYTVAVAPTTDGIVSADKTSACAGETVTLTVSPNDGYVLTWLLVEGKDVRPYVSTININTCSFTMPASNVTVTAAFHNPIYQDAWATAKTIIEETADFKLTQEEAPDALISRYRLADLINTLLTVGTRNDVLGNGSTGLPTALGEHVEADLRVSPIETSEHTLGEHTGSPLQTRSTSDFVISPYDIVIFNFIPATAGDVFHQKGIDGRFEFRVTPPKTWPSAYQSGIITATPFNATGNDSVETHGRASLHVWTQNGVLHVSGLTPGTTWRIYNLIGTLIYTGIVETHGRAFLTLPAKGIYIVTNTNESVKVVY